MWRACPIPSDLSSTMDYDIELERVANAFQTVPRKLSEANVRMLGALNHFETFEDELSDEGSKGKRLSLSGSIVVLDLDFVQSDHVLAVSVSLSRETASESRWSAMAPVNDPSGHLLNSLRQPRLEAFASMLSFLSRCDRFSTKDIDCFRALDLVSEAINLHIEHTGSTAFGTPVMNPPNRIGLGLQYLRTRDTTYYAHLDISPGARREFSLKKHKSVEDYLDTSTYAWKDSPSFDTTSTVHTYSNGDVEMANTNSNSTADGDTEVNNPQTGQSESDARAELVLSLDPPVLLSETYAMEIQAFISNFHPSIEQRLHNITLSVPKHPRFSSPKEKQDDFDVKIGVMLPYRLVEVSQIPLTGPAMIPAVLERLKQFALATTLINSLLNKGTDACWSLEAADLNIGDALAMREQPVHHNSNGQLSVSLKSSQKDNIEIFVGWVLSDLALKIDIPLGGNVQITLIPSTIKINTGDLLKLIEAGELSLALSYAVCSIGSLKRRESATMR